MSLFSQQFRCSIDNALHKPPYLISGDFQLSELENSNGVTLKIEYYLKPERYFHVKIAEEKTRTEVKRELFGILSSQNTGYEFKIEIELCPGEISQRERLKVVGASEIVSVIREWIDRLVEEIKNEPLNRKLEEQQKQVEEIEKVVARIEDESIKPEEITQIEEALTNMISELRARVAKMEEKDQEQASKIEDLAKQLEVLSQRLESTSKRGIVRAILTRCYAVSSDPKLAQLVDNAQKVIGLLGGGSGGT